MQFSINNMMLYGSLIGSYFRINWTNDKIEHNKWSRLTYRSIVKAIIVRIETYVTSSEITIAKSQPEAPNGIG